jgi:signal transduction histidine kinase
MRQVVLFLLYVAVVIRAIAFNYYDDPVPPLAYGLLATFGILFLTQPYLTRRMPRYIYYYLGIQFALVIAAQLIIPEIDFLLSLYFVLSFQAVFYFGRKVGFSVIAIALLIIFFPLMVGWEWQVGGWAVFLLDVVACFVVGNYAHLILTAARASQSNQQLSQELQQANLKLQDLAAQREELAVLQERSRMARELHDSVTQTIFSMNLAVQSAQMLVEKDLSQVASQLDRLQELARSAVGEIQVLLSQLRPQPTAAPGLGETLHDLVRQRQLQDGLQVDLQVTGDRQLPEVTHQGLYRIVQEALNNVAKHAGTNQAFVRLNLETRPASLEIVDHGCGFSLPEASAEPSHLGLAGMSGRANELGWKLQIESHPGQGTRIYLEEMI